MRLFSEKCFGKRGEIDGPQEALVLDPLIGAVSAGNVAVLKPSELARASSSFLANTIPYYLDCEAVKVVESGIDAAKQLLQEKWDKVFVTGVLGLGYNGQ